MLNICLILHSAQSDNLGVGALTISQIAILREAARRAGRAVRFTLIDWHNPRPPYVGGDDIAITRISARDLLKPGGFWRHIRGADLVVDIGGGDSFADIYGRKRLLLMFLMKFQSHLARRPFVLAPQTMGPFRRPVSRLLARASLRRCRMVCTRDHPSSEHLREIGYRGEIIEACDVALRLPHEPPPARRADARPRVGINVSGLLMNGGYDGNNMFGLTVDYPALIRRIVRGFLDHPDAPDVFLVPHVISEVHPVEDDFRASEALAAEFAGVKVAPRFASPIEAKSFIAGLDFFTGARMHSCIAAFSAGVPVVPMAYSRKFAGLFGSLGYGRTVDCTCQNEEEILARILDAFENRAALRSEMEPALAEGLARLTRYEEGMTRLIADLAPARRVA